MIFFRVLEEGFSRQDYFLGLDLLAKQEAIPQLAALCLPGVSDSSILEAIEPIRERHHSILITSEADLYDYLTHR